MATRAEYLAAMQQQMEPGIISHSKSLEACMSGLYEYFAANGLLGANEPSKEDWVLAGLIHDFDYSGEFKADHPTKTREALAKYGLSVTDSVKHIIDAHAPSLTGVQPITKADWSIYCADSLTGLITAVAYVYPSRKLADVKVSSVLKRFLKEPKFAAGTRRDEVAMCEKAEGLNISVEKLIEICLTAMQGIAGEIGL